MLSVDLDPVSLVDVLRSEGSDVTDIEAKRATDGYPSNLAPTLSAFGNMPGGGVIVLGLDEHDSFAAHIDDTLVAGAGLPGFTLLQAEGHSSDFSTASAAMSDGSRAPRPIRSKAAVCRAA